VSDAKQPHPSSPVSIVLIGLRGSGKSTLGRRLAGALSIGFVDLDDRTPTLLDAPTAADAINTHGLAAFRDAERAALETVLAELTESTGVVALGGGTPTALGAADLLRSAQSRKTIRVVYLHASPSVLRDRLSTTDTDTRPSLTGVNMLDEIETIYLQRDGLYRDLADAVIETADSSKADLVEKLTASLAHM
jgi:shikimate kinase